MYGRRKRLHQRADRGRAVGDAGAGIQAQENVTLSNSDGFVPSSKA